MARETDKPRNAGVNFVWPIDEDGRPMSLLTFQASELVGLPEYSNVTVGPASVTHFFPAPPADLDLETEEGKKAFVEHFKNLLALLAQATEESVAAEREIVHSALKGHQGS